MTSRTILSTSGAQAAKLLGVDSKTVYRWAKEGLIAAVRGPGGQWQVFLVEFRDSETPIYMTLNPNQLPEILASRRG